MCLHMYAYVMCVCMLLGARGQCPVALSTNFHLIFKSWSLSELRVLSLPD